MYYTHKIGTLKNIFNTEDVELKEHTLRVKDRTYAIMNDVIILLEPSQYPASISDFLSPKKDIGKDPDAFNRDIQYSFGEEWQAFPEILREHKDEFHQYFDLIDLNDLREKRICDLGCGIGRWTYFLTEKCRELILIDFSEAIFVARKNLGDADNVLYFMGDLRRLPFRNDFCDFLFCLGVLHHLPVPALDEIKNLKRFSPQILVYLYYALDNRPVYFRIVFNIINKLRIKVSRFRSPSSRFVLTWLFTLIFYIPLVLIGAALRTLGFSYSVPLYDTYRGKSLLRLRQDAYDRFFTSIEQRFSKNEIMGLRNTFSVINVSENLPYWHFLCER